MEKRPQRRRHDAGFTIFEVAVAAFIMAAVIATSLTVMARAFAPLDSARCISYASQIMQSEMEKMRLSPWATVNAYTRGTTTLMIDTAFSEAGDVGSRMTMTRTVADVHTGMISITLTISWTSYDGRSLSRSYTTYYGQNGLYDFFAA